MTCEELGVPVAGHKCEGPSTCLTFWELNGHGIAAPLDKLRHLKLLVAEWRHRRFGVVAYFPGFMEWHLVNVAGTFAISRCYHSE